MLLPEVLQYRAAVTPAKTAYTFINEDADPKSTVTYGELNARALAVAAELSERCRPGDRALLIFPQCAEFIVAFLGCLYAQVIAVPANPPRGSRVHEATARIAADCEPAAVLTVAALMDSVRAALEPWCTAAYWLPVDQAAPETPAAYRPHQYAAESIAFLQYTSGSTSAPKGVMVSHGNLAANEEMIRSAFGHDENSTVVGWAPFFHDQGLIGNVLQPLYVGATAFLMSPMAFIRQPLVWLSAISRFRAHTSGGPNFAYDACIARAGRGDVPDLDLSSWKVAFNGAEPIRADTIQKFGEIFAPYGFDAEALYPCYGLAEATLIVTGSGKGRGPRVTAAADAALGRRRFVPDRDGRTLVGSGTVLSDETIRIVDPETARPCASNEIGEIWVSGPNIALGYWRKAAATGAGFQARCPDDPGRRYLRTGDLGVIVEDELYVVGRVKDVIIIRGRNHYPQDIEHTVQAAHDALRPNGCAAFSVPTGEGEKLVVIQEIRRDCESTADPDEVGGAIRGAVLQEHETAMGAVVLTPAGQVPKTSSGKVMRSAAKERYLRGELKLWREYVRAG